MNFQIQIQRRIIIVVLALLLTKIESLRFDLESGFTKCITEDIRINSMTVGKYTVVKPNDATHFPDAHKITVRVTSALGNSYHHVDGVNEGQFAFQAVEAGDYITCFFASDYTPKTTITIDFDWKSGVAAKDWTDVAKKGSVESMVLELKKMFDTVQSIHEEIFYLRERDDEMQLLNASTNSKMAWLSYLSLIVSLSVAGLQLWHLKAFLRKKKVI